MPLMTTADAAVAILRREGITNVFGLPLPVYKPSATRAQIAKALDMLAAEQCRRRRSTMQRRTHFDNMPIKPQRVYEEMNLAFGPETRYVSTIGLSQIAAAQFLHVYRPRHWINAGQAGPLGWTGQAALGLRVADPEATVVALSGEVPQRLLLHRLGAGGQPRVFRPGLGELPALLQVARRARPARVPVGVLLDGQVPHVPGVAAVVPQHRLLGGGGEQPVPRHANTLSDSTDISGEVTRRFLPGLKTGVSTPRS